MDTVLAYLQTLAGPVSSTVIWLLASLGMLTVAVRIYTWITRYDDFRLIREGNVGVAASLAGTIIGLAWPLHAMIIHNSKVTDFLVWGTIALLIQVALLLLEAVFVRGMRRSIVEDKNVAAGVFLGTMSAVAGYLLAACITP
jgi:putative membrane protein